MNNASQHLRIGNYDEALASANRARVLSQTYEVYNLLARINYSIGTKKDNKTYFKNAEENFKRALNLKKTAPAYYNLGLTYLNLEDKNNSIKAFNKAKEIDSKYEKASSAIALLYLKLGDIIAAIEVYENIINEDPNSIDALENIGCLYAYNSVGRDELEHAKSYINKALEINPNLDRASSCLKIIERTLTMKGTK
jgi:tetratricopeptide (TPR) repeat protein